MSDDPRPPLGPEAIGLPDRVVLVTGAAAGIGAATAAAAARFGADVALCDRDGARLAAVADAIRGTGRRVHAGVLDVRDERAATSFVAEVAAGLGRVDVLVNNAGGGFAAAFLDVSPRGEAALVAENFTSVTSLVRLCVPHMRPGSAIVNVTSIEAHRAGPGYAVYSAMKAAVENLSRSLALELGDRGIRVNCVAPDVIPTPGIGGAVPVRTPLPVAGHPDDVAGAILFLASDLARFVTGTTLHVDGGNHAAGGWARDGAGGWAVGGAPVG